MNTVQKFGSNLLVFTSAKMLNWSLFCAHEHITVAAAVDSSTAAKQEGCGLIPWAFLCLESG